MYDLVIRDALIADGTGSAARSGDIAVKDGMIAEIGKVTAAARETLRADGALATPGFIDVHTHYDGQFLWDDRMDPSFSHGVTTAIAGNCGVGFAPVRPEHRRRLAELMEGVEDIPGAVLEEGLAWDWESFPDYLNRLGARRYAMDVAAHLTHAPLRVFVMGERALNHEPASPEDVERMAALVREAMAAGAVGVSAARLLEHLSTKGDHVPGTFASEDELLALAKAMGESGKGVFQIIPKGFGGTTAYTNIGREGRLAEQALLLRLARESGRPVTFSLTEFASDPQDRRLMVAASEAAHQEGLRLHPQVAARGVGIMCTLDAYHIFILRPSYRAIAHLPLAERAQAMRDPERRRAILAEADDPGVYASDANLGPLIPRLQANIGRTYPLSLPLDYEPGPQARVDALAKAAGKTPEAFIYDHYAAGDGTNCNMSLYHNYVDGVLDELREVLLNPHVISGLGDGGAHMRMICDASMPTFQLAFWGRDRTRGERMPVEAIVRKLSGDCADLYGLSDRGVLQVGRRADLNLIDFDNLALDMPRVVKDLPTGAPRLLQGARGYLATLVNGVATRLEGEDTGARPGRLARPN
jgi:N-acyl-D-aspartate/D-glutamate deacylase